MSKRTVKCGLIQMSNPINDESRPVAEIQSAMFEKHLPMIEEAGKKGVGILCLQEIFNGPYFCPSQDKRWYDAAEPMPGPTVSELPAIAKKYNMAMVVPLYEREMAGVYLQHRRRPRSRRHVPRQISQKPYSAGQSRVLREVSISSRETSDIRSSSCRRA